MTIFGGGFRGAPAFKHRNYRIFFAGQGISLVGTWMQQVAQGWLVLQLTGDPFWLGLVAAAVLLAVRLLIKDDENLRAAAALVHAAFTACGC